MNNKKASNFFVSHKSLGLGTSVVTLLASSAGVWILFSPVETISWAGLSGLTGYAVGQALPLLLIAALGVHMLRALPAGYSLPQWAGQHYGGYMRVAVLLICLFYLTIFLAAELTAIGQAGELLSGVPAALIIAAVTLLTWSYTNRGGFRLVVKTDIVQLLLLLPLLAAILLFVVWSSPKPLLGNIATTEPQLLSFAFRPGLEFAITLIIAISAAQIFNQSLWQRVYAAKDERVMRRAFAIAGVLLIPLIFATGYLGLIARNAGMALDTPAIGIFALLLAYADWWLVLALGLVALFLVMSSADSILNALSELVTEELQRRSNSVDSPSTALANAAGTDSADAAGDTAVNLAATVGTDNSAAGAATANDRAVLAKARWITSLFALSIAIIAAQGYSVLYLFLVADLLCAGSVVPVFAGLYSKHLKQSGALLSIALGIGCGALFMLRPDLSTPLISNPIGSSWLLSFASALIVSSISTAVCIWLNRRD